MAKKAVKSAKRESKGKQHAARAASFKRIATEARTRGVAHYKAARNNHRFEGGKKFERYMATGDALLEMAGACDNEARYLRTIVR